MTTNMLFNVLNNASQLQREVDRILGATSFWGHYAAENGPALRLGQDEEALYVEMTVPGVAPEDIDLSLEEDVLRIVAKRSEGFDEKEVTWHRRERGAREIRHRLRIPVEVDQDRITAVCKNGILTVTLPKAAAAKPKRIEVKAEK